MKIIKTTDTGRMATGYPVDIDKLRFEVAENAGAGDFVSLAIHAPDGHHRIELSFAEVGQINEFAEQLKQAVRDQLKQLGLAKRQAAKSEPAEAEHQLDELTEELQADDGNGAAEAAEEDGEDNEEDLPPPTTRRRARRPRGTAAAG